jgi:sugar phosphate permease
MKYLKGKSITFMLPHFNSTVTNRLILTKNDIGIIISLQNIAYALSKFFAGVLSDLVSCRILFGAGLFISGLLNIGFKKEVKVKYIFIFF